jgi:predicted nuclease of restriction endonuclease-like RecB superfamily
MKVDENLATATMLPSDLLIYRLQGPAITPKRLPLDDTHRAIATELIEMFHQGQGRTQGDLNRQLQDWEGEGVDYRIKRGLAHIVRNNLSTFEIISPLDPQQLRDRLFSTAAAAGLPPSPSTTTTLLHQVAQALTQELGHEVHPDQVRAGLYADLAENRILTDFTTPTPEQLLHRYNLSQVQGVFYKASHIVIQAHRNDPGEYKLLFRYLKLFGLMTYIEGDADYGFTITIDGPTSLFKPSTRYGLDIAKLIPALLHVSKWSLQAQLQVKDSYSKTPKTRHYSLDSDCGLVSHYPPGKPYDSMIEASFADRWAALKSDWILEREVDLLPIPGSVMIPDFRLVHPDGRTVLLEIVGYWRPEYLRKKFAQVQKVDCDRLILGISERLNLEKAGVRVQDIPVPVVWFKTQLSPAAVLEVLDTL